MRPHYYIYRRESIFYFAYNADAISFVCTKTLDVRHLLLVWILMEAIKEKNWCFSRFLSKKVLLKTGKGVPLQRF